MVLLHSILSDESVVMSQDIYVFEVNQKSFDQAVLLNSHKIPVIVEFMAVWSGPCSAMDNVFTRLAKEFAGRFIFAKVDIEEQEALAKVHDIKNVPTLMVFKDGKMLRTEVGELKEQEARQLLNDLGIYHQTDLLREQAKQKHLAGDTVDAINLLSEAIKLDAGNTHVVMDMVQIFIDIGELQQADDLYARLPESARETEMGKALSGQLGFAKLADKLEPLDVLQSRLQQQADDHAARFDLSIKQLAQYQYAEAVDNLFYICEKDIEYKSGAAREMLITVSNMMAPVDNDMSQDVRRRLANLMAG